MAVSCQEMGTFHCNWGKVEPEHLSLELHASLVVPLSWVGLSHPVQDSGSGGGRGVRVCLCSSSCIIYIFFTLFPQAQHINSLWE